mmetsp:Transcript_52641/g.145938  ORF Transcript_52641/g.145938 Transcript_52641/m.145938 type:complete len:717 (-) Transcript_52641:105-2255(-)
MAATNGATKDVVKKLDYVAELKCDEESTRHWRHVWCVDNNGAELVKKPLFLSENDTPTIAGCFNYAAKKYAELPCFGTRTITECLKEGKKQYWTKGPYEWKCFGEVCKDVQAAAKGLLELESIAAKVQEKTCVAGILADTSAEWQMSAQAAFQCGIPITTVYTTLGHDAMKHGLNETECSVLFIDWGQYDALLEPVLSHCTSLLHVVLIGKCFVPLKTVGGETKSFPSPSEVAALPKACMASFTTWEGLLESGRESSVTLDKYMPGAEDLAFIMYTSGSTGQPKGVMLSHLNFMALIAGSDAQGVIRLNEKDCHIAYLPLAHIFELFLEISCICKGARIGYGHAKTLTSASPYMHPDNEKGSDLLALRPTVMPAVPAILDLIKNGLTIKLQKMGGLKGQLVRGAVSKSQNLPVEEGACAGCLLNFGLKDVLLKKVKQGLGLEKLRLIGSGGAPLAPETQEFVTRVLAPVAQGYGATETCGMSTAQEIIAVDGRPKDESTGLVGAILPSAEIKLKSVEDMGYLVTDDPPRGEILLGGHTVSQRGYFKKMPEKSAEDFPTHADGKVWFHTGDIGVIEKTGALKIIDRKKDLIKLLAGEYVSLGKVEASLKQVRGIGAVVVFALASKDHCVAIVSQPEKGWDSVGGKPDETQLVKDIDKKLRDMGLARFEIPTKVKLDDTIWTPESGLVTASMKVQRNPLRAHYNENGGLLEQMDYRFP